MGNSKAFRVFLSSFFCIFAFSLYSDNYTQFGEPIESLNIAQKYLPENPIILEAGAYNGLESVKMAKHWPKGHVHSFEPVPELYAELVKNTQDVPNISTYRLALSDKNGQAEMFISEFTWAPNYPSQSSSLLKPKEHLDYCKFVNFNNKITVDALDLDTWARKNQIPRLDMLWLDMQGVELQVMKASSEIFKTVKVVLTEVEFVEAYESQSLYRELQNWLESQGFVQVGSNFDPKAPILTGWFGDALFVKKELLANE